MSALRLGLLLLLLGLGACNGGLLPTPPAPPQLFRLTPLPAVDPVGAARVPAQLLVDTPTASADLDTTRIALSRSPESIDYFANAAWTDRAPLLVQSLMVESLENAGQIAAVARQSLALRADAVLISDLLRFEAQYSGAGPPRIRIELDCRLVKMPDRSILASHGFAADATAAENETLAIIRAFDDAAHQAMAKLAPWVAQNLAALPK